MSAFRDAAEIERDRAGAEGARHALLTAELAWTLQSDDPDRAVQLADAAGDELRQLDAEDERRHVAAARLLVVRAQRHRARGELEATSDCARQALDSPGASLSPLVRDSAVAILASVDHLRGRQREARARLKGALAEPPTGCAEGRVGRAMLLNELGRAAFALCEWPEAHSCFLKALDLARREAHDRLCATLNVNLGNVHSELHDPRRALSHYAEALEIQTRRDDRSGQALTLLNLGELHAKLGDRDEAERCWRDAREHAQPGSHESDWARMQLASHWLDVGEPDQARGLIEELLDEHQRGGAHPKLGRALCLQSKLALAEGRDEDALRDLESARSVLCRVDDLEPALEVSIETARLLSRAGRHDEACELAAEVAESARKRAAREHLVAALRVLERAEEARGGASEALAALRERHALELETATGLMEDRLAVSRTRQALERALSRERDLESVKGELEDAVKSRTQQLEQANEELQRSLEEKRRSEREREKLAEQLTQSQKMEAVGRLAGGIAHDVNNLLTVLRGHGELLAGSLAEGSEEHDSVLSMLEACDRTARMTSQLLAFSRKRPREVRAVDLSALVDEMRGLLERLLGEDIELELRPSPEPAWAELDPVAIEQVLLNLAINARDAMPEGGRLRITTERRAAPTRRSETSRGEVTLQVSDTGAGIEPGVKDLIFEPFFSTKKEGTGLGLATSYGLVRQAGGVITVDSTLGAGTTFEVRMPAAEAPNDGAVVDPRETTAVEPLPASRRRILLVEDEPSLRHLLRIGLESLGHEVVAASHGEEALEALEASAVDFDVVVSDVVMPRMGGPQLLEELLKRDTSPPVLLTSGWPDRASTPPGRPGVDYAFLEKPFRLAELERAVTQLLEG